MSSRSSSNSRSFLSFEGYHRVGWIQSAHGIRGELFIGLDAGQADWLDAVTHLSLLLPDSDQLKEFEILKSRDHKEGLIVLLKGIGDRNLAETWRKAQVYIPEECLQAEPGETIFLHQIDGFEVLDKNELSLGHIRGFASNGPQDLLRLQTAKGEALVPFVDAFIVNIDFDKKQVVLDLPPGLLTLEEE